MRSIRKTIEAARKLNEELGEAINTRIWETILDVDKNIIPIDAINYANHRCLDLYGLTEKQCLEQITGKCYEIYHHAFTGQSYGTYLTTETIYWFNQEQFRRGIRENTIFVRQSQLERREIDIFKILEKFLTFEKGYTDDRIETSEQIKLTTKKKLLIEV